MSLIVRLVCGNGHISEEFSLCCPWCKQHYANIHTTLAVSINISKWDPPLEYTVPATKVTSQHDLDQALSDVFFTQAFMTKIMTTLKPLFEQGMKLARPLTIQCCYNSIQVKGLLGPRVYKVTLLCFEFSFPEKQ